MGGDAPQLTLARLRGIRMKSELFLRPDTIAIFGAAIDPPRIRSRCAIS
jgi:hypothetical protein